MEARTRGGPVWIYRWRAYDDDGVRRHRKEIVGRTRDMTKAQARLAVEGLHLAINEVCQRRTPQALTIKALAAHYIDEVLNPENSRLTERTRSVYRQQLNDYILPKWGDTPLGQIKTVIVQKWLDSIQRAPATRVKTRNVMSALFEHAIRYEWATQNPMHRVHQSSESISDPEVLTAGEVGALLTEVSGAYRTLVTIAILTGLRRGELFGLKWKDVDFERGILRIERSIVDNAVGEPKTKGSRRPLPITAEVVSALADWRQATEFQNPEDWIFASPASRGEWPYWPNSVMVHYIKPAADRAGITKNFNWHTFRRTFATLLNGEGADIKTTQELMRHASPAITLGTYVQAITPNKRAAQDRVAALIFPVAPSH